MKPPRIADPARILAGSWLERHGWKEKCADGTASIEESEERFNDLVEDVGALLAELLSEAETQKKDAAEGAFERARALCAGLAKAVLEDASRAPDPEARERFRAMSAAHDHDQQAIGKLSAGPPAGARRVSGKDRDDVQ